MDAECSQLLPHVCSVLVDNRQLMTDSSCYEKLLDWFKSLISTVPVKLLLEENPCIVGLFQQVLTIGDMDPNLLSFSMRLVGMLAAREEGFNYLLKEDIVQDMFGEYIYTNAMWKDATVRRAWIQALLSMVQHKQAVSFLSGSGIINVMLNLQTDSSLFVASASIQLVAHTLLSCVEMNQEYPNSTNASDWPESAQTILTHLEKSLSSGILFSVTQSIKALTEIYKGSTEALAMTLWSRIAVLISSLLTQKPIHGADHLEELLLSVARFPSFANPDCDFWILLERALKCLNPLQTGSLALGIMKLKHCPQAIGLQALSVLLHPLDCILKASSAHFGQPGLLDELVSDPAAVENLLISKSSCAALLCQCLCHLQELCHLDGLTVQIPCEPLLVSVLTVLQFCIGQAASTSPVGSCFSRSFIGCLRVQRSALDALGALSCWPLSRESVVKTYNVLFAYLENPDTDPTVLKKTLQATVKWLQASSVYSYGEYWSLSNTFLQDQCCPVLQKRLCSPLWEIRDTTLEFLTQLMDIFKENEGFRQVLGSSGIPQLVLALIKDPESYVRASAVSCLGHLVNITPHYPALAEGDGSPGELIKREDLVTELFNILSHDTEGFPRRAVVKVFTDWLKKGHMQNLKDPEKLVSNILKVTLSDLDWEVKVNALDLADVFLAQTLGMSGPVSCPYTVGLMSHKSTSILAEELKKCHQVGLFKFLLASLCDCDRPVALRSCDILISVKPKLCDEESITSVLHGTEWLECALQDCNIKDHTGNNGALWDTDWVTDILMKVDLDSLKSSLSKSSGHIHETPQSLLHDIRATLWGLEENDADCY
ncbi:integrator complex assembly factor BRAT1 [Rhinophrynus dorsalis]